MCVSTCLTCKFCLGEKFVSYKREREGGGGTNPFAKCYIICSTPLSLWQSTYVYTQTKPAILAAIILEYFVPIRVLVCSNTGIISWNPGWAWIVSQVFLGYFVMVRSIIWGVLLHILMPSIFYYPTMKIFACMMTCTMKYH
jgi:hypothetical protein